MQFVCSDSMSYSGLCSINFKCCLFRLMVICKWMAIRYPAMLALGVRQIDSMYVCGKRMLPHFHDSLMNETGRAFENDFSILLEHRCLSCSICYKILHFNSTQRFNKHICHLFFCHNMIEQDKAFLKVLSNTMVIYLNMLFALMKHWISIIGLVI